ncbi:MAG: hypothetical protein MRZ63_09565 [Anaerostipes sp.]|nr:hypothetical protein [Anaerostipes sp.]
MIFAIINDEETTYSIKELWQYDYGQVLRIQNLNTEKYAIEIHFSTEENFGESITRIATNNGGSFDVTIPDSVLENKCASKDYFIYAFIYITGQSSGNTIKKIIIPVRSRPKPEGREQNDNNTMTAILKAVNSIADGKADGLKYEDNILKLLSGENTLASVEIKRGSVGTGREIELQNDGIYIQWRYAGDESWTNLIALEDIKGPAGQAGEKGDPGTITPEQISEAVEEYMASNPFEETDPTVPAWAKQPNKPSYTAQEVGALPAGTKIPSRTSDLQNDSGFLTEHQDLSGYALKSEVPKSASDVGADASGTAENKVSEHNASDTAHNDIRLLIQNLINTVTTLLDSDDETLDQTSEIVAYVKSNKSLIDAITTSKVSVLDIIDNLTTNVANKPLSASQGVKLKALIDAIIVPTKLSELENDSGYAKTTDIPDKLPNPQKLTFTGAVTAEYDGSGAVTVTIPEGSGGSGSGIDGGETDPTVPAWAKEETPDKSLTQEGKAADAKEVGDRLGQLSDDIANELGRNEDGTEIDMGTTANNVRGAIKELKDNQGGGVTQEQIDSAVASYLNANPVTGGLTTTAKNLLITILRNAMYTTNQSANITALESALASGSEGGGDTPTVTYAITNNLTNCVNSNVNTSVVENSNYVANITANEGYVLDNVVITMGEVDITSSSYSDGQINITNVTGNIIITASASESSSVAELPTNGLLANFDFRNSTFESYNLSGWGNVYKLDDKTGDYFIFTSQADAIGDNIGLVGVGLREIRSKNNESKSLDLGNSYTICLLTRDKTTKAQPTIMGCGSNVVSSNTYGFCPEYENTLNEKIRMNQVEINYPRSSDYMLASYVVDGNTLKYYFDNSLMITYNESNCTDFNKWNSAPVSIGSIYNSDYVVGCVIYNRALSDIEVVEVQDYFKTLEVTA